jgi:NADPH-dependent 2,4-dienoyl-CoA reductase/sulfur reductase-like enzyme
VIQREATLARLEPAQRRHVDVGPGGDLVEGQAALRTQLPQPSANAEIDVVVVRVICLHGKLAWHLRPGAGKLDFMDIEWDCVVVGGGAAGLSAALVLGRSRRRTLVVDEGEQSNLAAHGIGGLLGHDGRPPAELYAAGRAELSAYPTVEVRHGAVTTGASDGDSFVLELTDGSRVRTRRVLLATGMAYEAPPITGLAELWGRSAFHCPFCHGWEARDQPLAVLAQGDRAVHLLDRRHRGAHQW